MRFLLFGLLFVTCQSEPLNSYIAYEMLEKSPIYKVAVDNESVFVAKEYCFGDSIFHTTQFVVEGETVISISVPEAIQSYTIHPLHLEIEGKTDGNGLTFSVDQPQMMMVKINNYQALCLFQTPPETNIPDAKDEQVIYFPKGVHEVGIIRPKSGQTIYLEQGALVKGRIYGENVENVKVMGRGILDARGYTSKPDKVCGLEFKNAQQIKVEGIGLRTGEWWQSLYLLCDDVEVSHMNLMSFGVNNDGIDIDGVTNFKASNCFIGCGDDGFGWHALDAEANGEPPTRNCLAENCLIYNAHAGNGLRVGASMETQLFEDITFRDITVVAHKNAGIRSDHSDWAKCKNIRFQNFYIEQASRPIEIRIEKTRYSNSTGFRDERGHFDGLYFENVQASGGNIVLEGFDSTHLIQNVFFTDCYHDGLPLANTTQLMLNDFVRNTNFR
ncbi:MAG: glycosyl hydrolase family 28 protein [Bacteroidota bacterium]